MKPEQKHKWLEEVDFAMEARGKSIDSTQKARNSADSPMTSRYDTQRDIFNNDLNMLLESQENDVVFRKELESASDMTNVESGAVVNIDIDGDKEVILFMKNSGRLSDVQVVTPNSPLGSSIQGKEVGDKVSYSVNNYEIGVKILEIS